MLPSRREVAGSIGEAYVIGVNPIWDKSGVALSLTMGALVISSISGMTRQHEQQDKARWGNRHNASLLNASPLPTHPQS